MIFIYILIVAVIYIGLGAGCCFLFDKWDQFADSEEVCIMLVLWPFFLIFMSFEQFGKMIFERVKKARR